MGTPSDCKQIDWHLKETGVEASPALIARVSNLDSG